ncbi:hypothetical protein CC80DRAFT_438555, partial [Byssothecium circinans]
MEALAAVGLAGNIVQFVDFSCKLFDQTLEICASPAGVSQHAQSIENVTKKLRNLSADISRDIHKIDRYQTTSQGDHQTLKALATDCEAVATELIAALQSLPMKGSHTKWRSFKVALSSIWKESRIQTLEQRVRDHRSQMIIQLQVMQSDQSTAIYGLLNELLQRSEQPNLKTSSQIMIMKNDIQVALRSLEEAMADKKLNNPIEKEEGEGQRAASLVDLSTGVETLRRMELQGSDMLLSIALGNLAFDEMSYRHSAINNAHPSTLQWVFKEKFVPWLQSSEPLFWISGKPGSGKSTLLKHLVDHPDTPDIIQQCIGGKQKYITVSYFFWVNGTPLQRSQEGLLRALLYEILSRCPALVEHTLPETWEEMKTVTARGRFPQYTKQADLLAAFKRLAKLPIMDTQFCFFIDGLDEYGGDQVSNIPQTNLRAANIKLCVASRPWNVFEEAFGAQLDCKLYLQDLNKPDIFRYTTDELQPVFDRRHIPDASSDVIIEEVVEKSQGVFLWVYLVVRSLKEGLRNEDPLSLLQQRLQDFPSDLKEYFDHMFNSIDPMYRKITAHMFQFALAAQQPLQPLSYWFLDAQEDDLGVNLALTMPIRPLRPEDRERRILQTKKRINGRCKGLLEINTEPSKKPSTAPRLQVDFLHRTVRDFLMTSEMQATFGQWQRKDFDPLHAICDALLAELK